MFTFVPSRVRSWHFTRSTPCTDRHTENRHTSVIIRVRRADVKEVHGRAALRHTGKLPIAPCKSQVLWKVWENSLETRFLTSEAYLKVGRLKMLELVHSTVVFLLHLVAVLAFYVLPKSLCSPFPRRSRTDVSARVSGSSGRPASRTDICTCLLSATLVILLKNSILWPLHLCVLIPLPPLSYADFIFPYLTSWVKGLVSF